MSELSISKRKKKSQFVSHASDDDMRNYQYTVSEYPPLSHEAHLRLSRQFRAGRNAEVSLEERALVDAIVDGDWSDESLEEHKSEVISAYSMKIAWISGKRKPAAVLAAFAGGDDASQLYYRRFDEIMCSPVYTESLTIAGACPVCEDMSEEQFVKHFETVKYRILDSIEQVSPKEVPKDVIDRWKERAAGLPNHYLTSIRSLNMSPEQEKQAKRDIRKGNAALDEMINHNLQLAMSRVSRMMTMKPRAKQIGAPDLIGAANMGLVYGARQFDPDKGRKFSTYVAYHIDAQLYDIINQEDGKSGIKGMTPHEDKQYKAIMGMSTSFEKIYRRQPTMYELQSLTGISSTIIKKRLSVPQLSCCSLDAPLSTDDGDTLSMADKIASEHTVETEVEQSNMESVIKILHEEIAGLPRIQRKVLEGKTGIRADGDQQPPKTVKQIAKECNISPHDVPIRYADAMEKLKERLEKRGWSSDILPFSE